jgi:hypothetical protein
MFERVIARLGIFISGFQDNSDGDSLTHGVRVMAQIFILGLRQVTAADKPIEQESEPRTHWRFGATR